MVKRRGSSNFFSIGSTSAHTTEDKKALGLSIHTKYMNAFLYYIYLLLYVSALIYVNFVRLGEEFLQEFFLHSGRDDDLHATASVIVMERMGKFDQVPDYNYYT